MKVVAISQLKARLSEYVAGLSGGEEVLITDRGRPVARLTPPRGGDASLEDLERGGVIRRGRGLPPSFHERTRPLVSESGVEALLDERRSGR